MKDRAVRNRNPRTEIETMDGGKGCDPFSDVGVGMYFRN